MKIGELGRTTGFKDKTIRYYERQGLLPDPGRTPSGYREYGPEDVDRLQFVRKAKRLGLSLEEIRGILRIHDQREATCNHVCALLDQKLAQTDALIQDLQAFRKELAQLRSGQMPLPTAGQRAGVSAGSSRTAALVRARRP